jgi:hypothetical protein
VTVVIEGVPMCVPAPADALVVACVHRAAHHHDAPDLLWLYDIHLLASRLSHEEWRDVVTTARAGAVSALCRRGLELAAACFDTPVPSQVTQAWQGQTHPEPSAAFLRGEGRPLGRLRNDLAVLAWPDKVRLVREVLFPPRSYMRAAFGPRGPWPWWYARRAVLGAVRWMRHPQR